MAAIPQQYPNTAPFQSASLYVGDLHNEVTESLLFELFNRVGPVASIRVCRDSVTRRSLGYAYVNFHNVQDAERALDTMNFTDIKNKPCRIMWSQRDPSLRKSGVGNVFVSSLAPSVDNKGLYDTFSVFGNILSCKVATDENGASKGYGYVHFETAEAAQDAIQKFNGTLIDEVEVHVGSFVRKQDRAGQADWTNLYVKQFPQSWDEAKLRDLFAEFGPIANVAVTTDAEGKGKGFGFVNFAEHESAVKALAELTNKTIEDPSGSFELYVSRAQKKVERVREIKTKLDAMNHERVSKYQGMNLYVKNISDTISDDTFREAFAQFGTITSARIMRDPTDQKTSKGFGFICYSSPEEATRAVTEMNGKSLGSKPIVVTLHQRKEQRRAHLAQTYGPPNMRGGFPQGMGQGVPMPPYMGMYMPQGQPGFPGQQPRAAVPYPYPMPGRGSPNAMPRNMPFAGGRPQFYPQQMYQQGPGAPQQIPPNQTQPTNPSQFKGRGIPQNLNAGGFPSIQSQPGAPNNMVQQQIQPQSQVPGLQGRRGSPQGLASGPGMNPGRGIPPQQMGMNGGRPLYPQQPTMQSMQQQQSIKSNLKFSNQARNQNGQMHGNMSQGMGMQMYPQQGQQMLPQNTNLVQQGQADFSDASLASADPLTQKNMIGERLYPLIYQHQPDQAGKITGMLLEMDNGELLNLIESPDALMSKIEEALNVLKNHRSDE
eukprot:gene12787-17144_t